MNLAQLPVAEVSGDFQSFSDLNVLDPELSGPCPELDTDTEYDSVTEIFTFVRRGSSVTLSKRQQSPHPDVIVESPSSPTLLDISHAPEDNARTLSEEITRMRSCTE